MPSEELKKKGMTPERRKELEAKGYRQGKNGGMIAPAWSKGNPSPNKNGRPRSRLPDSILEPFLDMLAADIGDDGYGRLAKYFGEELARAMKAGDYKKVRCILDVMDRTDGPVQKRVEISRVDAPPVLVLEATEAEVKQLQEGFGGAGS